MTKTEASSRQELQKKIDALKERLDNPPIFPTEVYTRIVGYYRSVAAWNKGKREEYNHREMFRLDKTAASASSGPRSRTATTYLFFFRQTCPACPAMKSKLDSLDLEGVRLDVDTPEGLEAAVRYQIMATPTVIFLDDQKSELLRLSDVRRWSEAERVVAPV